MFRDENEKHRLNFSRSSEKNLSQFSRDLARTRILADLCDEHVNDEDYANFYDVEEKNIVMLM